MYTTDSAGHRLTLILGIFGVVALLSAINTGVFMGVGLKEPLTWVQLVLGVAGIGAYLWVNIRRVRERFSGRGAFFLVSSLVTGTYQWRIKGPGYLATAGNVTLGGGTTRVDMGTQPAGDITGDNVDNIQDFNAVKTNFGQGGAPPIGPGRRGEK